MDGTAATGSTSGSEPTRRTRRRRSETTTWILQVERTFGDEAVCWIDVQSVTVPAGTKRKTALLKAAEVWGEAVPSEGVSVRLVPADDLGVSTLRPKPAPPQPELEVV